jgi:hypothetical protein
MIGELWGKHDGWTLSANSIRNSRWLSRLSLAGCLEHRSSSPFRRTTKGIPVPLDDCEFQSPRVYLGTEWLVPEQPPGPHSAEGSPQRGKPKSLPPKRPSTSRWVRGRQRLSDRLPGVDAERSNSRSCLFSFCLCRFVRLLLLRVRVSAYVNPGFA